MNIPLSNRLKACASFVTAGASVADIGCDHGYLGIHLLTAGIANSIIAADLNEQPLNSAVRNAEKFGVRDRMRFYLSDGAAGIPRDFDTMVCAGMGADTMISILSAAPWLKDASYTLILQCQSRRQELRRYLSDNGYAIQAETLARDGKFIYPVMRVCYEKAAPLTQGQCYISPALLHSGASLLPEFYQRVRDGVRMTVAGLQRTGGARYEEYRTILAELDEMEEDIYGDGR